MAGHQWATAAKNLGIKVGVGEPTPEAFEALGLPTNPDVIYFTRPSSIDRYDECGRLEWFPRSMGLVPDRPEPTWADIGNAGHEALHATLKDGPDEGNRVINEWAQTLGLKWTEFAETNRSVSDAAHKASELVSSWHDVLPKRILEELAPYDPTVLHTETRLWMWIPATALGAVMLDPTAIMASHDPDGQQRGTVFGKRGVCLLLTPDAILTTNVGTMMLQCKTSTDDDIKELGDWLAYGYSDTAYLFAGDLLALQEGWAPVRETALLMISKEPRPVKHETPPPKTLLTAAEKGHIKFDVSNYKRLDCTDKQAERYEDMWSRWSKAAHVAKHLAETWPNRLVRFQLVAPDTEEVWKFTFKALLCRLHAMIHTLGTDAPLYMIPMGHKACRLKYGNGWCPYKRLCLGGDMPKGDLEDEPDWKDAEDDYVDEAHQQFVEYHVDKMEKAAEKEDDSDE